MYFRSPAPPERRPSKKFVLLLLLLLATAAAKVNTKSSRPRRKVRVPMGGGSGQVRETWAEQRPRLLGCVPSPPDHRHVPLPVGKIAHECGGGGFNGGIHAILHFDWTQEDGAVVWGVPGSVQPASPEAVRSRRREYADTIALIAAHPAFEEVHVLLQNPLDRWRLEDLMCPRGQEEQASVNADNSKAGIGVVSTLVLGFDGRPMNYSDAVAYAMAFVPPGRIAAILNADVVPVGPGWMRVHKNLGPKTVFALSRYHGGCTLELQPKTNTVTAYGTCEGRARIGSTDAVVFAVPAPAANAALSKVVTLSAHPTFWLGAENSLLVAFRLAGYAHVLNPCNQLWLWHNHCSHVKSKAAHAAPRIMLRAPYVRVPVARLPYLDCTS